jgi:hypothetical protein
MIWNLNFSNLSFELSYKILRGRLRTKRNMRKQSLDDQRSTPCLRNADLKMTHIKRERTIVDSYYAIYKCRFYLYAQARATSKYLLLYFSSIQIILTKCCILN